MVCYFTIVSSERQIILIFFELLQKTYDEIEDKTITSMWNEAIQILFKFPSNPSQK